MLNPVAPDQPHPERNEQSSKLASSKTDETPQAEYDGCLAGHDATSDGIILWRVANAWQRAMRSAFATLGLTHVQFILLRHLFRPACDMSQITQAMIARQTGVDEMMTSQVLRALVTKGLIVRQPHLTDTRAKVIALSSEGANIVPKAVLLAEVAEQKFFGPLEEDRGALISALRRLLIGSPDTPSRSCD